MRGKRRSTSEPEEEFGFDRITEVMTKEGGVNAAAIVDGCHEARIVLRSDVAPQEGHTIADEGMTRIGWRIVKIKPGARYSASNHAVAIAHVEPVTKYDGKLNMFDAMHVLHIKVVYSPLRTVNLGRKVRKPGA